MKRLLNILILTFLFSSCNESSLVDNQYKEYLTKETNELKSETEYFLSEAVSLSNDNKPKYGLYLDQLVRIESGIKALKESVKSKTLKISPDMIDFEDYFFMPTIKYHTQMLENGFKLINKPIDDVEQVILLNQIEKFRNAVVTNYYLKYFEDDGYFKFNLLMPISILSYNKEYFECFIAGIDTTRHDKVVIESTKKEYIVSDGIAKIPTKYKGLKATYYFLKDDDNKYDYQFTIGE